MKTTNLLLILTILATCGAAQSYSQADDNESFTPVEIGYEDFKLVSALVKIFRPEMTSATFLEEGLQKCNDWILNDSELKDFMELMTEESQVLINMACDFYPCYYTGIISNGKVEYEIAIYGGAFISINKPSSKYDENATYFVSYEESTLFITTCWSEEQDQ
jgi:hypothetical protein